MTLNRLGETASWDEDVLRVEFEELVALDENIFVTGFEAAEIDALLLNDDAAADEAVDAETSAGGNSVSQPGNTWLLGRHRLHQGDARDPAAYACPASALMRQTG